MGMRTTKLNYRGRPPFQSARVLKCKSCHRRYRHGGADAHLWNVEFAHGIPLRLLCPGCQTGMQSLKAEALAELQAHPDGQLSEQIMQTAARKKGVRA